MHMGEARLHERVGGALERPEVGAPAAREAQRHQPVGRDQRREAHLRTHAGRTPYTPERAHVHEHAWVHVRRLGSASAAKQRTRASSTAAVTASGSATKSSGRHLAASASSEGGWGGGAPASADVPAPPPPPPSAASASMTMRRTKAPIRPGTGASKCACSAWTATRPLAKTIHENDLSYLG